LWQECPNGVLISQVSLSLFQPEIDVVLSVNEPLLDESQLKDGNLMTVTVESLFSPPDSWQLQGQQYFYTVALPIPANTEVSGGPAITAQPSWDPMNKKSLSLC
jgi:hypothetical protein